LATVQALGLRPTTQPVPEIGPAVAGPRSLSLRDLKIYYRGARFAAQVMGLRHAHRAEGIKEDSKAYVAEIDRFTAALEWLEGLKSD
ncbi:MAG: hypothetical protein ABR609_09355, partial [Acidimicrobiia bacterium]